MLDLHMHSKYSADGVDEVVDMLKQAESLKLKCISITDHNACGAYNDLKNEIVRKNFSGDIIPGVELNTKILGIPIEILGYNLDPYKMQKLIDETYMSNIERNKYEVKVLYEKCTKIGIKLPDDFVQKYDGSIYGSKYLYNYIKKDESNKKFFNDSSWEDSNVFYREYMSNPKTDFFVDMDEVLPNFDKTCEIVREAGGLVFIPHIYEYRENSEKILKEILDNHKIDGIECYYRNFSKDQTEYLLDVCKMYNLFVSGGSDYHGYVKPHVKMGTGEGKLSVPDCIIEDWKKVLI